MPASASSAAQTRPLWPPPTTIASNDCLAWFGAVIERHRAGADGVRVAAADPPGSPRGPRAGRAPP